MKEKNLIDFKDEYAIENGHGSWYDMRNANEVTISDCEEVALRYANHVKAIALQEGKKDLLEIQKWSDKYEFSFQFWGMGNNNVFVEKDGTELYSTGGHETPELAIKDALNYVNKINP